jgi:hypothetical protein
MWRMQDRFVYFGAIEGLTALGDVCPNQVIGLLVKCFTESSSEPSWRLKLGESLVKIAGRCGALLPVHGMRADTVRNPQRPA